MKRKLITLLGLFILVLTFSGCPRTVPQRDVIESTQTTFPTFHQSNQTHQSMQLPLVVTDTTVISTRRIEARITNENILQVITNDGMGWTNIAEDVRSVFGTFFTTPITIPAGATAEERDRIISQPPDDSDPIIFYITLDYRLYGWGHNYRGLLGDGTEEYRPWQQRTHIMDNVATVGIRVQEINVVTRGTTVQDIRREGTRQYISYAITTCKNLYVWGNGILYPTFVAENIIDVFIVEAERFILAHSQAGYIYRIVYHNNTFRLDRFTFVDGYDPMPVRCFMLRPVFGANNIITGFTMPAHVNEHGVLTWNGEVVAENVASIVLQTYRFRRRINDPYNLLFITTAGDLWGIGANDNGQLLGDGTAFCHQTPVHISGSVKYARPYTFILHDGTMWVWCADIPFPRLYASNVATMFRSFVFFQDGTRKIYTFNHFHGLQFLQTGWINGWIDSEYNIDSERMRVPQTRRFY